MISSGLGTKNSNQPPFKSHEDSRKVDADTQDKIKGIFMKIEGSLNETEEIQNQNQGENTYNS